MAGHLHWVRLLSSLPLRLQAAGHHRGTQTHKNTNTSNGGVLLFGVIGSHGGATTLPCRHSWCVCQPQRYSFQTPNPPLPITGYPFVTESQEFSYNTELLIKNRGVSVPVGPGGGVTRRGLRTKGSRRCQRGKPLACPALPCFATHSPTCYSCLRHDVQGDDGLNTRYPLHCQERVALRKGHSRAGGAHDSGYANSHTHRHKCTHRPSRKDATAS